MKTATTTDLTLRLQELFRDLISGRIERADYEAMREPLRAELDRRERKARMAHA